METYTECQKTGRIRNRFRATDQTFYKAQHDETFLTTYNNTDAKAYYE